MLYAEDTGVVLLSPEHLRKMVGVIVVVCAAFGLTISEVKTEPESTAVFRVEAAGQM